MPLGILGKKVGMTNTYNEAGEFIPVTIIEAGPCFVAQIKTQEKDKYSAVQLVTGSKREKLISKPLAGHLKKHSVKSARFIRELKVKAEEIKDLRPGQELKISSVLKPGDTVKVIGTSKGKGYQGVVKRHHFHGADAGHGTHEFFRHGGSIGLRFPQHTNKGMKMPGHMGNKRVTLKNLTVLEVSDEKNMLVLSGSVPGPNRGYLVIEKTN